MKKLENLITKRLKLLQITIFRPDHEKGGMIFAVTDAFRKKTIFGLELVREDKETVRLNLFWTEPGQTQSQIGQSWDFKYPQNHWLRTG